MAFSACQNKKVARNYILLLVILFFGQIFKSSSAQLFHWRMTTQ